MRRGWHIYLLSNENLILSFIDTNLWIPLHLFLASIYDLWREGYTYSDPNIDSTFLFKNCPKFLPIYLSFHFYEKPKLAWILPTKMIQISSHFFTNWHSIFGTLYDPFVLNMFSEVSYLFYFLCISTKMYSRLFRLFLQFQNTFLWEIRASFQAAVFFGKKTLSRIPDTFLQCHFGSRIHTSYSSIYDIQCTIFLHCTSI